MDNGITFLPNDRYLLENGKFRLYYTSECSRNFIVVVEDNFGNSYELEFDFNNSNRSDNEEEKDGDTLPVGYYRPVVSL